MVDAPTRYEGKIGEWLLMSVYLQMAIICLTIVVHVQPEQCQTAMCAVGKQLGCGATPTKGNRFIFGMFIVVEASKVAHIARRAHVDSPWGGGMQHEHNQANDATQYAQ
jgi:hypothetical protein